MWPGRKSLIVDGQEDWRWTFSWKLNWYVPKCQQCGQSDGLEVTGLTGAATAGCVAQSVALCSVAQCSVAGEPRPDLKPNKVDPILLAMRLQLFLYLIFFFYLIWSPTRQIPSSQWRYNRQFKTYLSNPAKTANQSVTYRFWNMSNFLDGIRFGIEKNCKKSIGFCIKQNWYKKYRIQYKNIARIANAVQYHS